MSGGSSAALTTTHLPQLRGTLDEWREKQPAPKPFTAGRQDLATRLADENAVGAKEGKDIVVAFRTRPSLPNEAEEKFHAVETKEEAAAARAARTRREDGRPCSPDVDASCRRVGGRRARTGLETPGERRTATGRCSPGVDASCRGDPGRRVLLGTRPKATARRATAAVFVAVADVARRR